MLFNIAKKSHWLQNFVIRMVASLHPSIEHNIAKVQILKKAFFHCELEAIEGSYFEFGVYEGSSLYAAVEISKRLHSKFSRNYYGFDSFDDGFKYFSDKDIHPFFKEGDFKSSYEKTKRRFKNNPFVRLIKGYFENTIADKLATEMFPGEKCAVVFIDCDLTGPAELALEFIKPILQSGSVIILDDYWAYRGAPDKGTCGAFTAFLRRHPDIKAREYYSYGFGGKAFIIL